MLPARRRFHIFTIFTLIMRQATLIASVLGPWFLVLGPLTAITWAALPAATAAAWWLIFIFLLALRLLPHLFYLLAASTISVLFFLFLLSFFFCIFAISAGHKQRREEKSVAWRHNELKFIGSFGKIREIY